MRFLKKPIFKFIVIIFLPVLLVCGYLLFYKAPFVFTRQNPAIVNAWVFTDTLDKGSSKARIIRNNNDGHIEFYYTLHAGFQYPYAGVNFVLNKDSLPDLSGYNYISLKIKANQGSRLPIVMGIWKDSLTSPKGMRFMEYILPVNTEWNTSKIDFERFRSPEWWWKLNGRKEGDLGPADFSKIRFINVQSCQIIDNDKQDLIEIEEVSLHVNMVWFYIVSSIIAILYYTLAYLLFFKRKAVQNIVFSYNKKETENRSEKEETLVLDYITSHYDQASLSITDIQTGTGISEAKISSIIKNKSGLTFKQFLNKLRLTESKRLLQESDLQISEIAFKVGYSNVTHFNRVFKEMEDCSPNDFRKKDLSNPDKP